MIGPKWKIAPSIEFKPVGRMTPKIVIRQHGVFVGLADIQVYPDQLQAQRFAAVIYDEVTLAFARLLRDVMANPFGNVPDGDFLGRIIRGGRSRYP